MKKFIIVAVDDQPAILHTIASVLSEHYQVKPFASRQIALKYMKSQPADLVLLDIDMPGMAALLCLCRYAPLGNTKRRPSYSLQAMQSRKMFRWQFKAVEMIL